MATKLPPTPVGMPPGSDYWNDWYERLRTLVNDGNVSVLWSNINFAGSTLSDIASRDHNVLQSIQGGTSGERYHLTAAEYAAVQAMGPSNQYLVLNSLVGNPTTTDIPAGQAKMYKNTTTSVVSLWVNDAGTLKSVALT